MFPKMPLKTSTSAFAFAFAKPDKALWKGPASSTEDNESAVAIQPRMAEHPTGIPVVLQDKARAESMLCLVPTAEAGLDRRQRLSVQTG